MLTPQQKAEEIIKHFTQLLHRHFLLMDDEEMQAAVLEIAIQYCKGKEDALINEATNGDRTATAANYWFDVADCLENS